MLLLEELTPEMAGGMAALVRLTQFLAPAVALAVTQEMEVMAELHLAEPQQAQGAQAEAVETAQAAAE